MNLIRKNYISTIIAILLIQTIYPQIKSGPTIYSVKAIESIMKSVCNYQIENPSRHTSKNRDFPNGWVPASFYTGVMEAYRSTNDADYLKYAQNWAEKNEFKPGPRLRHADDHCCGQTYLDLYLIDRDSRKLTPIQNTIDSIMATPLSGREDWWWCDALFMAPPTLVKLSAATGNKKYINFMHKMYWDTAEYLFDRSEGLFYRDAAYFYRRSANGEKVFWSRGNGWVIAGLARLIPFLDEKDKKRSWYIELFRTLSASLKPLQGADGLWRASLHDPEEFPNPETSGSGFICYALAWGINNNILDRNDYLPAVEKAWKGLNEAIHDNGKIGWVQQIGKSPEEVNFNDTQAYGAGAFLLAGSEMLKLYSKLD